jgi:hypothetical protein
VKQHHQMDHIHLGAERGRGGVAKHTHCHSGKFFIAWEGRKPAYRIDVASHTIGRMKAAGLEWER